MPRLTNPFKHKKSGYKYQQPHCPAHPVASAINQRRSRSTAGESNQASKNERQRRRKGDRLLRQPVQPPRGGGALPQGSSLRAHPGEGPAQQERAAAAPQPRAQEGARAPPRRPPRRLRVARHRRVRRRGVPRPAAPPRRPRRPRRRPLLGPLHRRQVLDVVLAGDVDGGRGAAGVHEGDQGEPQAAGGAGEGEAVLRRRRRGLPRRRRQRVRALAPGLRGGRWRQRGHRRGVPGPVPVGEGVHLPRRREAVPARQGGAARPFQRQEGLVCGHGEVNGAGAGAGEEVVILPACMPQ